MFMMTYSGIKLDILNPCIQDIKIEDIAHALSLQCRYNGHCNRFYSVAEHCVLAARMFRSEFLATHYYYTTYLLYPLLHDAAEAYVGDLISPVKGELPGFQLIEERFLAVIGKRFGLHWNWFGDKKVKQVDRWMLTTEMGQLFSKGHSFSGRQDCGPDIKVKCWTPKKAEKEFLKAFRKYYI